MKLQPDMHDYTPAARGYWWTIVSVGAVILGWSGWEIALSPWETVAITIAAAVTAAVIGLFPVHIPGMRASVACADIFTILTMLAVGLPSAICANAAESFVGATRSSRRWTSRLITPGQNAISLLVCGSAFQASRPMLDRWLPGPAGLFVGATVFGVVYYAVSCITLRLLFAFKNREPLRVLRWLWDAHVVGLWYVSSAAVAALIYLGLQQYGWSTLLVAMPIIAMFLVTYHGLDRYAEMSRRKSEFLAQMSHELRTPLNAIIGGSQIVKDGMVGPLTSKQSQWMRDIHESGEHLLAVINDILDMSKIEAGRMQIERANVQVRSVVDGAITLVKDAAARKHIDLRVDVPADTGAFAVDERKIKQVLLNLLSNAIKFTPDGGQVGVTARRDGAAVELAVHDTGVGIAPEDQATVFDAFRQVGKDAAAKAMGTGLGLTLARDLVALHGGALTLQSEPGRGSVFTIRLP